ncbi:MAG TPA: LysR substrate-binding domain-containing protein [Burkholderiaceae bacterium]|nr:LysR substrate-binding domain-containing protein [Burkholderiaceae bacterium]
MKPSGPVRSARRERTIGLSALRGFEASARRMSFTLAAAELNLTQSSISRQVAELERQVGTALFARQTRALALTAAGQRLFQAAQQALKQIDHAVDDIRGPRNAARVTITTYASFASLWLVPRLAMFQREHPQIELRIDASDRFIDIDAEGVDVAIRWTRAALLPNGTVPLHEEEVVPALSPLLLERSSVALKKPQDLFQLPLLELDRSLPTSASSAWPHWFQFAGVRAAPPAPRLMFTFVDQSVQAAVRGQGVVLTRSPFVDELVASGDLVTPFPKLRMPTGYQYALIVNVNTRETVHVAAFCAWIRAEFERGPFRQT